MAFQPVLAGSGNVDIAYGPEDTINPLVMNLGPSRNVDVKILVKSTEGKTADQKTYKNVELSPGRTVNKLDSWKPNVPRNAYYAIEYIIIDRK